MTKISLCLNWPSCYGRKILIVFATWSLQNGHLETADEHLRQSTWPHGTIVMSTSLVKHTRQSHAAFAVSASFAATSAFSCNVPYQEFINMKFSLYILPSEIVSWVFWRNNFVVKFKLQTRTDFYRYNDTE